MPDIAGAWPYWTIFLAAIIEGEIAYLGAAALVAQGQLNTALVVMSGASGAAIGDQIFFYALRGRLSRWMARYPSLARKAEPLVQHVRLHDSLMILLIRFAPGLRIAIAAACAWADVSAVKFSLLNFLSSIVWAVALIVLVGHLGPALLAQYGLGGWRGAAIAGVVFLALFKALGAFEARMVARSPSP